MIDVKPTVAHNHHHPLCSGAAKGLGKATKRERSESFVINVNLGSWSPLKRATVTTAARAESSLE